MALTPEQEGQIADLLTNYNGLLDISNSSADILAALGYGDVMVTDLPAATALAANDFFYLAKSGQDVKASIQQLADFVVTIFNGAVISVNGNVGAVTIKSIDGQSLMGAGNIATTPFSNPTTLAQVQATALSL